MKLRIRSMATKETQRINIVDTASLIDLKTLIASTPAFTSSSNPNPDDSIHLSLNRSDELVSQNPTDSLKELGLTTGDLLFFSLTPFPPNSDAGTSNSVKTVIPSENSASLREPKLIQADNLNQTDRSIEPMEIDYEPKIINKSEKKPNLIPEFLTKLIDLEKNDDAGILGQVIKITHAALLDTGFILHNGSGLNLPEDWSSKASTLDLKYTIPDFMDQAHTFNDKVAILRISIEGNYGTIYGYFTGKSDFYRVCFDLGKFATLLSSNLNSMNQNDQKEFLEIFRALKDGISLPLMVDLCIKNNLLLPPCFMRLSTDVKSKILDLITGADVARVGSTCTEMRNLSLDENLWKQKLEKEFQNSHNDISITSAREKYKGAYVEKMSRKRNLMNLNDLRRPIWRGTRFVGPSRPGFCIIGGNYDRYPVIGDRFNRSGLRMGRIGGPHGRQVSPSCHFGSGGDNCRSFFDE